jgi:serine phosphatase RsbU (regulator of sigma subunit)
MKYLAEDHIQKSKLVVEQQKQIKRLEKHNAVLEDGMQQFSESVEYAGRLQQSILPAKDLFNEYFTDSFVFFAPRDVVSGDFYWLYAFGDDVYFAVGDCTGHGVPGALVNIAGNTILRQLIRQDGINDPGIIMYLLNEELVSLFNENMTDGSTQDGMDIVFCKFNLKKKKASYCGAGRPLVLVRGGQLIEFKKGPSAIGYHLDERKVFETESFDLEEGDTFYLFSDGYTDQFGGENVKKFNRKRFRNLLLSINEFKMKKQGRELELSFDSWKGKHEQIDDVCVLGVRV